MNQGRDRREGTLVLEKSIDFFSFFLFFLLDRDRNRDESEPRGCAPFCRLRREFLIYSTLLVRLAKQENRELNSRDALESLQNDSRFCFTSPDNCGPRRNCGYKSARNTSRRCSRRRPAEVTFSGTRRSLRLFNFFRSFLFNFIFSI